MIHNINYAKYINCIEFATSLPTTFWLYDVEVLCLIDVGRSLKKENILL